MKTKKMVALSVYGLVLWVGVSAWAALSPGTEPRLIRGQTEVEKDTGGWTSQGPLAEGKWIRSMNADTTIKVPGATLRLQSGTAVNYTLPANDSSQLALRARGGRMYVRLDENVSCQVTSPKSRIQATQGEFVVDADFNALYVLRGNAHLLEAPPTRVSLQTRTAPTNQVALDGPDVRRRTKKARRFTKGEESKGRRIGEDEAVKPERTAPPSPAYTPPPSPPYNPPVSDAPVVVSAGGPDWALIGGGAVLLTLGGVLISNNLNNQSDTFEVTQPVSP